MYSNGSSGFLNLSLQFVEDAVAARRVGRDHDVVGRDDLGERPVVAHDVLDQLHRLAEQRLAVVVGELVAGLLALLLVGDVAQIVLLSPVPRLAEMLVGEDAFSALPSKPTREEDVVEPFAQPVVEGVFLHHRVEQRRQRLQPLLGDGGQFRRGRQPAGERQRDAAQQPAIVEHGDAVEERRRVLVVAGDCRAPAPVVRSVHPADELRQDAIARRVGLQHFLAAVVEPAGDLQQQARLISLLRAGPSARTRRDCAARPRLAPALAALRDRAGRTCCPRHRRPPCGTSGRSARRPSPRLRWRRNRRRRRHRLGRCRDAFRHRERPRPGTAAPGRQPTSERERP